MRAISSLVLIILFHTMIAGPFLCTSNRALASEARAEGFVASPDHLQLQINSMSLEQKIGQLLIFGMNEVAPTDKLEDWYRKRLPGAVVLFSRNMKSTRQVIALNQHLQRLSQKYTGTPLFIAIDQEGGTVSRVKTNPPLPSALALGSTNNPLLTQFIGHNTGRLLSALGFNFNLAPVADVADPESESFLGTRVFSKDPMTVGKMSSSFSHGLQMAGVLSTLKHFPGHGNEAADPHHKTPVSMASLDELLSHRLKPFEYSIKNNHPAAIMIAHMALPRVDSTAKLATFSKVLISDVLRKRLKYKGLIMTDDIDMAAIQLGGKVEDYIIQSLQAGTDLVMVAWNQKTQKKAVAAIKAALQSGGLTIDEINKKVHRILLTKTRLKSDFRNEANRIHDIKAVLNTKSFKSSIKKVTQINLNHQLDRQPASSLESPIFVLSRYNSFYDKLSQRRPGCCRRLAFERQQILQHYLERQPGALALIHVSGDATAKWLAKIPSKLRQRVIVVNTSSPSLVRSTDSYQKVINLYSWYPQIGSMLAEKLIPW